MATNTLLQTVESPWAQSSHDGAGKKPTAAVRKMQEHDRVASLWYFKEGETPRSCEVQRYKPLYEQNEPHEVLVRDIRDCQTDFSLDVHGFELHHHPSAEHEFDNEDRVAQSYHTECTELIKKLTGARYFLNSNHLIRREPFSKTEQHMAHDGQEDEDKYPRPRAPVRYAHVDQSYSGAQVLKDAVLDELKETDAKLHEELSKSPRWQILTIWRPIRPIQRDPLAVADARSVPEGGYVDIPIKVNEDFELAMAHVRARTSQQTEWYYAHAMVPEEILLFKTFDSWDCIGDQRIARAVPHASFVDPSCEGVDMPARASIEFRTMVFY